MRPIITVAAAVALLAGCGPAIPPAAGPDTIRLDTPTIAAADSAGTDDPRTRTWSPEQLAAVAASHCTVDDILTGVPGPGGSIISRCHARSLGLAP